MNYLACGVNAVSEALKVHPTCIQQIVLSESRGQKDSRQLLQFAKEHSVPVEIKNKKSFDKWLFHRKVSSSFIHQGIACEVSRQLYLSLEDVLNKIKGKNKKGMFLVLDEIQDPHNLGALIRSAACAGVDAVVIGKRSSVQITPTVVKVAAGGIEHIDMCRVPNIQYTLDKLKKNGYFTLGLDIDASSSIFHVKVDQPVALVVGSEDLGLRNSVKNACDQLIKIPMSQNMDSLNASVAGAVAMFSLVNSKVSQ